MKVALMYPRGNGALRRIDEVELPFVPGPGDQFAIVDPETSMSRWYVVRSRGVTIEPGLEASVFVVIDHAPEGE